MRSRQEREREKRQVRVSVGLQWGDNHPRQPLPRTHLVPSTRGHTHTHTQSARARERERERKRGEGEDRGGSRHADTLLACCAR